MFVTGQVKALKSEIRGWKAEAKEMAALERHAALQEMMELEGDAKALEEEELGPIKTLSSHVELEDECLPVENKASAELEDVSDEHGLVPMKTLSGPEDECLQVENKASAELEDVPDEKDLVPIKTLSGQAELEDECLPVENKTSAELEDVPDEKGLVPMKTLSDQPELEDLAAECLRAESKDSVGPEDIPDVLLGQSPEWRDDSDRNPARPSDKEMDTTGLVEDLANVLNCEWTPGMWEQLLTLKDAWRQKWHVSSAEAANCVAQARMRDRPVPRKTSVMWTEDVTLWKRGEDFLQQLLAANVKQAWLFAWLFGHGMLAMACHGLDRLGFAGRWSSCAARAN